MGLGYPTQAVRQSQEALALAQELAHPYSQVLVQHFAIWLHHRRREVSAVQAQADALLVLATAHGFPPWAARGVCWRGWALAMQGQSERDLAQLCQGMAAVLATGNTLSRPFCLVLLAEAAGHANQGEEGLCLLAEALTAFEPTGRGDLITEAYRLQGELACARLYRMGPRRKPDSTRPWTLRVASRPNPGSCGPPRV
jgi:hypothetical protein